MVSPACSVAFCDSAPVWRLCKIDANDVWSRLTAAPVRRRLRRAVARRRPVNDERLVPGALGGRTDARQRLEDRHRPHELQAPGLAHFAMTKICWLRYWSTMTVTCGSFKISLRQPLT